MVLRNNCFKEEWKKINWEDKEIIASWFKVEGREVGEEVYDEEN